MQAREGTTTQCVWRSKRLSIRKCCPNRLLISSHSAFHNNLRGMTDKKRPLRVAGDTYDHNAPCGHTQLRCRSVAMCIVWEVESQIIQAVFGCYSPCLPADKLAKTHWRHWRRVQTSERITYHCGSYVFDCYTDIMVHGEGFAFGLVRHELLKWATTGYDTNTLIQ